MLEEYKDPAQVLTDDLNKIIAEINSPEFTGMDLPDLITDFEEILRVLRAFETLKNYLEK